MVSVTSTYRALSDEVYEATLKQLH